MDGSIPECGRFHILIEFGVRKKVRFLNASSAATYGSDERGFSDDELELKPLCWDEIFKETVSNRDGEILSAKSRSSTRFSGDASSFLSSIPDNGLIRNNTNQ